jgi:NAD(P)-dependent dehydrogenase (short-subunit alcohol dehydrogenase family)
MSWARQSWQARIAAMFVRVALSRSLAQGLHMASTNKYSESAFTKATRMPDKPTRVFEVDPRERYPRPPFSTPQQSATGTTEELEPKADHGEQSYVGHDKLRGCTALITGGDSGIGRAIALAFAREGADVVISYLSEEEDEDAQETRRWIAEAGRRALLVPGDLCNEEHCHSLVDQTMARFGRLDILVNNAGYQKFHEQLQEMTASMFDRVFRTNVYAPFFLSKAALRHMRPGGSIINTASIQAYKPSPALLAYATSKSAIIGMTKALAPHAMKHGVRVNAVAPGPVWTPLIPATTPADDLTNFGRDTLLQRPAQPVEIAPLYVWLASAEASYVTGEVFGVTGGQSPV